VLGYFQWETKQYKKIPVGEQVEVLSLLGDVAVGDPGPTLHLHEAVSVDDGQGPSGRGGLCRGGAGRLPRARALADRALGRRLSHDTG
jgi:predicted DNA-binding protein with PD1-like motif